MPDRLFEDPQARSLRLMLEERALQSDALGRLNLPSYAQRQGSPSSRAETERHQAKLQNIAWRENMKRGEVLTAKYNDKNSPEYKSLSIPMKILMGYQSTGISHPSGGGRMSAQGFLRKSAAKKLGKELGSALSSVISPKVPDQVRVRYAGDPVPPRPPSLEELMAGGAGTIDMPQRPLNPVDARLSELLAGTHQLQIR